MKKVFILISLFMVSGSVLAASGGFPLESAEIKPGDKASLQNGAKIYVNYCLGCHALGYLRYNRLGRDLGISDELVKENLIFTQGEDGSPTKIGETMTSSMDASYAESVFAAQPPDLSLTARSRGVDWLYTYLHSFYVDESKPWGTNNAVFPDVSMPHVLSGLQGMQKAIIEEKLDDQGNKHKQIIGFELMQPGSLSAEDYDQVVRDLTNFLAYAAEPAKMQRIKVGVWVIAFLVLLSFVTYFLKKEYWRDIK